MLKEMYKTIALYLVGLLLVRIMGKRTIAQLSPFDLIVMVIMGAAIAIPLEDDKLHLGHGITPIVMITAINWGFSKLIASNRKIENFLQGSSTVLVRDGKAIVKNLKRERVTMADLLVLLREKNITDINEVLEATLEPNGKLSVIKKRVHQPITTYDLGIHLSEGRLPTMIVDQGKVVETNLDKAQTGLEQILKELNKKGITRLGEIKAAWLDEDGELSIDKWRSKLY